MPYTIESHADLIDVALVGKLGYDTIAAMLEELDGLATAALPARVLVLVDETNASPGILGLREIRRWVHQWKLSTVREGRTAVVAPTRVMYGLNRMAHGVAGAGAEEHLAVFHDRDAALEWLRRPEQQHDDAATTDEGPLSPAGL